MQSNRQTTYKPDINIVSADSVGFFFFFFERERADSVGFSSVFFFFL